MQTILIVDDSATSRMLFKIHLPAGHTYVVHEATDLASALSVAAETKPCLVVLDYNLPEHNGVEIARQLLAMGLQAKLVLLTANAQQAVIDDARSVGITLVYEKPITKDLLNRLLEESL